MTVFKSTSIEVRNLKKFFKVLIILFSSTYIFGEFPRDGYYYCEGNGMLGIFSIVYTIAPRDNPYEYDEEAPSREYIHFDWSKYPYPFGYIPITDESEEEIFLEGRHLSARTDSKKEEPFFLIFNKKTLSFKMTSMDYKGKTKKINSKCCKSFVPLKKLDDGTYQLRHCK